MTESVYDGAQTASDILIGYRSYLRTEMVNLTDKEIEDLIKKLEKCADNSHGPRRHEEVQGLIDICRTELDERDLVRCLKWAGLIVGIDNVDVISENDVPKYEYELEDNKIVISEKKTLAQSFLEVIHPGKAGLENLLDTLEYDLELIDEKKLTALQYELDMFREDLDDFLTPEQVEWFNRLYDAVSSEVDARWLLKRLEERHIVKIGRRN